jgi:hypothetical protein
MYSKDTRGTDVGFTFRGGYAARGATEDFNFRHEIENFDACAAIHDRASVTWNWFQ